MSSQTEPAPVRAPLSRDRVLRAAVALADRDGLAALTMRRLAEELGVEAMSLYHHVDNKEAVLDGVVDVVVGEIVAAAEDLDEPTEPERWHEAMRMRILAAREVLLRHRWAPRVIETRTRMSMPVIAWHEGLLALMRHGGFSYDLAHHAMHALGSRALGFQQELFDPGDSGDGMSAEDMARMADRFPHLVAMLAEIAHDDPEDTLGWCDDQTEFEFGLDVLLGGLDHLRRREQATGG